HPSRPACSGPARSVTVAARADPSPGPNRLPRRARRCRRRPGASPVHGLARHTAAQAPFSHGSSSTLQSVEYRQLGGTGLEVSRIGLGCGNFGGIGSAPELFGEGDSEEEAFALMDAALEAGVTFL